MHKKYFSIWTMSSDRFNYYNIDNTFWCDLLFILFPITWYPGQTIFGWTRIDENSDFCHLFRFLKSLWSPMISNWRYLRWTKLFELLRQSPNKTSQLHCSKHLKYGCIVLKGVGAYSYQHELEGIKIKLGKF